MPLVAHNNLPTFSKLEQEGLRVLAPGIANEQDMYSIGRPE